MAVSIHLAKVDGARLSAESLRRELVVPGWADDVDVTGTSDSEVLLNLLDAGGFPAFGSGLVGHPGYFLARVNMQASSSKFRRVYFDLVFSTDAGGDVNAYIIRDRTGLAQIQTQKIGGKWLRMDYLKDGVALPKDNLTIIVQRPMRSFQVTRIIAGEPSDTIRNAVGKANNATWKGLPVGYWLLTEVSTDLARYGGYYQLTISASTKVSEDWSTFGVMQNKNDGKFITATNAQLAALIATGYSYDITYADGSILSGVAKVGPYDLVDFSTVFGF